MITAFDREVISAQAEEIGIEGLLQKPVSQSILLDMLVNVFGVVGEDNLTSLASKAEIQSHDARGIRILLVEDNEVNQQIATELLESVGASVTVANHGAEAVRILTAGDPAPPFDIVFMDLQMPEMDGFTATKILRSKPNLRDLPIVAMTAHAMTEEIERCLESGMDDHVGKPIEPHVLFATIDRWTHRQGQEISVLPAKRPRMDGEVILAEIEGVDVADGLQRVASNKRLYRDLLAQFANKQHAADEQIAAAIESGDYGAAERLAHSLKGIAGNLGIYPIFHAAEKLEIAIRERNADLPERTREFGTVMDRQVRAIRQALDDPGPDFFERHRAEIDGPTLMSAIAHLRELLEASDADATESCSTLVDLLTHTRGATRSENLAAAVNRFDFEAALSELEEIARELATDWRNQ